MNMLRGALLFFAAGSLGAQAPDTDPSPHSDISLVADQLTVRPGSRTTIAIRMTMDAGWHTYWTNPGDAGLPLGARWTLPAGVTVSALQFPTPRVMPQPPLMSYGYQDELFVLADLDIAPTVAVGTVLKITAEIDWLICEELCFPASGTGELTLKTTAGSEAKLTKWSSDLAMTRDRLVRDGTLWPSSAWRTDSGYAFLVVLPTTIRPAMRVPYFFADSMSVVEHAATQRVRFANDTLIVSVVRSPFGSNDLTRLQGVLVGDASVNGAGYHLDIALTETPVDADRRAALLSDTTGVMRTGGSLTGSGAAAFGSDPATDGTNLGLLLAMGMAFLGGLLLNLMPCVFPVLSVKILSFVERGGDDPKVGRMHAMVFTYGVLLAFWILAGSLYAIRAGGAQLGWGFQLQSPPVVAVLALTLFALALNMSGVFTLGAGLTRLGAVGGGTRYVDSFFTGLLAVVVATPCTAPFMGAALGYALTTSAVAGFAVFTALGLGLAVPYIVLASSPSLLKKLPRPGAWVETLKQALAFPLYATVVWLLWVLGRQAGNDVVSIVLLLAIVVAIAGWAAGRAQMSGRGKLSAAALIVGVLTIGSSAVGVSAVPAVVTAAPTPAGWETWSPAVVAEARQAGRVVFVDFTAAWCLSCQVNERIALHTTAVERAFADANVLLLRADWTSRDPDITKALAEFGRSGVPLYVVYSRDPSVAPALLPAVLTPGIVISAIATATASPAAPLAAR